MQNGARVRVGFRVCLEDSGISWHLGMNAVEKWILCRGEHSPGTHSVRGCEVP